MVYIAFFGAKKKVIEFSIQSGYVYAKEGDVINFLTSLGMVNGILSPSIHKFGYVFIHSGLSAE